MSDTLRPIDQRVRTQWRLESLLVSLLASIALGVALVASPLPKVWAGAAFVGAAIVLVSGLLGLVEIRFRSWRYGLGDDVLVLEYGVWTRRRSMTPYYRVQNVDLTAGPLERWLGLQRLTIKTASASTDATIPGLDASEATDLRLRILERAGRDAAV